MKKILLIILTLSTQVSADTVIDSGYFSNKVMHWDKAGSPYIINANVNLSSTTLNITDAKVVINGGSLNFFNKSVVHMEGVTIENKTTSYALGLFNSKVHLKTVDIDTLRFIESYSSDVSIDGLTSFHAGNKQLFSLYNNTNMSMNNSHIENYQGTVFDFFNTDTIQLEYNKFINNSKVVYLRGASSTRVTKNDFEKNTVAVESYLGGNFEDNYIEKETAIIYPYVTSAPIGEFNILAGPFSIQTFSKVKNVTQPEICCSNVLFLPGVMGSRLYLSGIIENQLWEPNKNSDVKKLYLDEFGKSINNIFTKDIIVKTNLLGGLPNVDKDIYKAFIEYLEKIKKKNTIQEYNAVPYDWRMSADFILHEGIKIKEGNIDLIQKVKDLQKTSKTKKVSIITHSNGGLVAKQLILELQRLGLENMIDKIIFVAMPEYGTAQAITALMFGHNQSLAGGLIMRSSIARELGKNMPAAYTFLPSDMYYRYSPNSDRLLHETVIRNYSRLNPGLLEKSKELHQKIDNIVYSKDTAIYQILGTGVNTMSDISLDDKNIYKIIPLYNKNGDGVVQDMYSSRQGTVLYVDLNNTIYKHTNIMNNEKVINYVNNILDPMRTDFPEVGLDYNKIIKNNNFKFLRITPSVNKISQYISPLEMDLSIGVSKIKDNTDNELYFDRYSANTTNDFRIALEHLNNNRFEEYDDSIQYLYTTDVENFSIKSKTDNTIDISIIESIDSEISTIEYKGVPIFKNSEMSFDPSNDSVNSLNMTLPLTGQTVQLTNAKQNPELSINEKIDIIISSIQSSKMDWYLKERYKRRIELYRINQDAKYLETLKKRVTSAISSITGLSNNASLKSRYTKAKEDYIFLNFLLLKL